MRMPECAGATVAPAVAAAGIGSRAQRRDTAAVPPRARAPRRPYPSPFVPIPCPLCPRLTRPTFNIITVRGPLALKSLRMARAGRSVFVGNIPYSATEEQLEDFFRPVGQVVNFRCVLPAAFPSSSSAPAHRMPPAGRGARHPGAGGPTAGPGAPRMGGPWGRLVRQTLRPHARHEWSGC